MQTFLKRCAAALLSILVLGAIPASATDVVANDALDVYVISGAALLDGSYPEAHAAATCTGCHWRIIRTCATGALEDRRNCLGVPCPAAEDIAEVWRADAPLAPPVGDPHWEYRGLVCLTHTPTAVASISAGVRDAAIRGLPPLRPVSQPAAVTLTGLPTLFRSGQPAGFAAPSATVAGVQVSIRATPSWTWDFGQGAVQTTSNAGAPWPGSGVRHSYPRRGIYRVRVTATWNAVYDANGVTDLPVDGVLTQSAWFDLRVREARRFLRTHQGA